MRSGDQTTQLAQASKITTRTIEWLILIWQSDTNFYTTDCFPKLFSNEGGMPTNGVVPRWSKRSVPRLLSHCPKYGLLGLCGHQSCGDQSRGIQSLYVRKIGHTGQERRSNNRLAWQNRAGEQKLSRYDHFCRTRTTIWPAAMINGWIGVVPVSMSCYGRDREFWVNVNRKFGDETNES